MIEFIFVNLKKTNSKMKGICKLCKKEEKLTYEHFPPRAAFNKKTKFQLIGINDYYKNFNNYYFEKKPIIKSKINQGGIGSYCLCENCNNFLGYSYSNDYIKLAKLANILLNNYSFKSIEFSFEKEEINLKNVLKQILSIIICNNDFWFTKEYPELLEFVMNKNSTFLPEKYKIYMYLNNEGVIRNGGYHFINTFGNICDFAFRPLGFVLSINNGSRINILCDITRFKFYEYMNINIINLTLNKLPTHSPYPMDFREYDDLKNEYSK